MKKMANVEYFYRTCDAKLGTNFLDERGQNRSKKSINIGWVCRAAQRVYDKVHAPKKGCGLQLSAKYTGNENKIAVNEDFVDVVVEYLAKLNHKCWTDCACYKDLNCACDCNAVGVCSKASNCNCNCTCNCNQACDCECGRTSECQCDCAVDAETGVCDCNCGQVANCSYGKAEPYQNCDCACACNCACYSNCYSGGYYTSGYVCSVTCSSNTWICPGNTCSGTIVKYDGSGNVTSSYPWSYRPKT